MKKKLLAILMTMAMTFSLAACGSDSGETKEDSGGGKETSGDEIVIGCLQDITGSTSGLGISVQKGAQAAVDEINENGGIDGKDVVLKTYDTKGDVTEAVNAYITAVTVDEVSLVVGPPVANIANAIKETSESYDTPVMGFALDPTCQLKEDGSPYKNMFCFQPSATSQGQIMAAFALENELKANDITVDENLIVAYGAADADYKTLLEPLVSAGVDAIYCPNYTQQLVAIKTAADELGYEGKLVCGLDAAPAFNTTYGGDCSNVYYINNINTDDPTTIEMSDEVADDVSAVNKYFLGYDVVMIAKECIEEAGLEDADALRDTIANVNGYKGLTGTITMDPETHMPKDMSMFMYTYDNQTPVMLGEFGI